MGDLWRSKKMQLIQMIVQNDAAHSIVTRLGELGIVQLRDVRAAPSTHWRLSPVPPAASRRDACAEGGSSCSLAPVRRS